MELAIDTATNFAGVALSEKGDVLEEISWHTRHNHTVEVLPAIESLLKKQNVGIADMEAIMVIRGPGSFNGLRVGLATAKGLAFPAQIPLVSVGTLEAIAFALAESGLPIHPIIGAGRNEIATACFQNKDGQWQKLREEYITTTQDLISGIDSETVFCGEIDDEKISLIRKVLGPKAIVPETAQSRVGCLCRLGWRRINSRDYDDIQTLQPLYLKRPSITVPRKRRHDAMSSMRARSE